MTTPRTATPAIADLPGGACTPAPPADGGGMVQNLRAAAAAAPARTMTPAPHTAPSPVDHGQAPDFQRDWDHDANALADAVRKIGRAE